MDKISIPYVVKKCGPVGCEQNAYQPRSQGGRFTRLAQLYRQARLLCGKLKAWSLITHL